MIICQQDAICENCGEAYNCADRHMSHAEEHSPVGACSFQCQKALNLKVVRK